MASAHEPGEVRWVEVPGGWLAHADLIAKALEEGPGREGLGEKALS
jgi:hypothetical protein